MITLPRNIRILSWIINVFFWGLIVFFSTFFLSRLLMILGLDFSFLSKISLPVNQDIVKLSSIIIRDNEIPVKVSKLIVSIDISDLTPVFQLVFTTSILISGVFLIYAVSRFRELMKNVCENIVFNQINVTLLKQAAYAVFINWLLNNIFQEVYYRWYFDKIDHITIKFPPALFTGYFIIGLVIMAIAFIFERGVKLKKEQELTI